MDFLITTGRYILFLKNIFSRFEKREIYWRQTVKEINMLGPQPMNYNKNWKSIEIQYDRAFPSNKKRNTSPTIPGLNLHDCKIMQNWFGYALGIGDKSINSLNENITFSTDFYRKALARLKIHQF